MGVSAGSGKAHNPTIHREIAKYHIVQRRRSDVKEWLISGDSSFRFSERDQREEIVRHDSAELAIIKEVSSYGRLVKDDAKNASGHIQTLASWTVVHLHKCALSSPFVLRYSLNNRKSTLERRLEELTEEDPGLTVQDAHANVLDDQVSELVDEDEIILRSERISPGSQNMIRAELHTLEHLLSLARQITTN